MLTFLIRIDNRRIGVDHSIHIKGGDILNCKIDWFTNLVDIGMRMEAPIGQEIHILDLKQGEKYYAFSTQNDSRFRGIFTDYWTNTAGYKMVNFHNGFYKSSSFTQTYGPFQEFGMGIFWRVFEPHQGEQSYKYYRVSRFTEDEKKELLERCVLRERRQYERGLTGSTNKDMWLPRDLVREISLHYLTDSTVGCASRWR